MNSLSLIKKNSTSHRAVIFAKEAGVILLNTVALLKCLFLHPRKELIL